LHDGTITATPCGRTGIGRRKINLSQVFAGQNIGIKEVADTVWLVSFMHYDLGSIGSPGRIRTADQRINSLKLNVLASVVTPRISL